MGDMLAARFAVPSLVVLAAIPFVTWGWVTQVLVILATAPTLAAVIAAYRRTPRGRFTFGAGIVSQTMTLCLVTCQLLPDDQRVIIASLAGAVAVLSYLVSVLGVVRARRPYDYADGVFDAFAALLGMVVIQWQWGVLDPDATLGTVASATTPFMGVFCLITVGIIFWRIAMDGRQDMRIPLAVSSAGGLMVVTMLTTATFTAPDPPWWGLSAWLMAQYCLAGYFLAPTVSRIFEPEPPRRRLIEMRWFGPAATLIASPLMMLAYLTRDATPTVLGVLSASLLTVVALWRGARLLRERENARRELAGEQRFRALVERTADVILTVDTDLRLTYATGGLRTLLGRSEQELVGAQLEVALGKEAAATVAHMVRKLAGDEVLASQDVRLAWANGAERYATVAVTDHRLTPTIGGWVLNLHDVTERKEAELTLASQARTDALTGLPNRAGMRTALTELLVDDAQAVAVLFCDLDGFKDVNDRLGHEAGDEVLRLVAGRWSALMRSGDMLGRWGGDEFLVICRGMGDHAAARDTAQRLTEALREPLLLEGGCAAVGASVGVAVREAGEPAERLIARADTSMYEAKRLLR